MTDLNTLKLDKLHVTWTPYEMMIAKGINTTSKVNFKDDKNSKEDQKVVNQMKKKKSLLIN